MQVHMICIKYDQKIKKHKFWTFEDFYVFNLNSSAKCGLAIACHLSVCVSVHLYVCPSVMLVDHDHIG